MQVKELIEALNRLDPEAEIVMSTEDGGGFGKNIFITQAFFTEGNIAVILQGHRDKKPEPPIAYYDPGIRGRM